MSNVADGIFHVFLLAANLPVIDKDRMNCLQVPAVSFLGGKN